MIGNNPTEEDEMPLRGPEDRPTNVMDRYRERLNEEMKERGESDRSLAKKMAEIGYSVPFTSINKTRNGNRQPSLDECATVAWLFGYESLDDFMVGPKWRLIARTGQRVATHVTSLNAEMAVAVQEDLRSFARALRDPEAVAAADAASPGWREEFKVGMTSDLRHEVRTLVRTWERLEEQLEEIWADLEDVDAQRVEVVRELDAQRVEVVREELREAGVVRPEDAKALREGWQERIRNDAKA